MVTTKKPNSEIGLHEGNPLSKFFFFNLGKITNAGVQKPYQFDMLFKMHDKFTYAGDYPPFQKYMDKYLPTHMNKFLRLVTGYHNGYFLTGMILIFFNNICQLLLPISLSQLVSWIEDEGSLEMGIILGLAIVVILCLKV